MINVSLCHVGCHQSVRCGVFCKFQFNLEWECNEFDVWYIFCFHEKVK